MRRCRTSTYVTQLAPHVPQLSPPCHLVTSPPPLVQALLGHIVEQKFEQRSASSGEHDGLLLYLCGEQAGSAMEVSYTKQQQKQKQMQTNKSSDQDTIETF